MNTRIFPVVAMVSVLGLSGLQVSAQNLSGVKEDNEHVRSWNAFAEGLLRVHRHRMATRRIQKTERLGGYARMPDFYREIEYHDADSGRLLSRIRWEREQPGTAHTVEAFFYDKHGRVSVDYLAAYLPGFRNAPIQTLINVHYYDDGVHAFRQFDASGNTIFERCQGDYFDRPIDISLDDGNIPPSPQRVSNDIYVTCFGFLPLTADRFLKPAAFVPDIIETDRTTEGDGTTGEQLERRIADLSREIAASPNIARLYARRGRDLFLLNRLDDAVADFTQAIQLDDGLDAAYFGRGMAFGRIGEFDNGIRDLTVFIRRNPKSSLAYTKRGVRYIWKTDFERARKDLEMAVNLDNANSEAHDDLGVALAQLGKIDEALRHLRKAKALEPGYQKVHHNLAMVYYMTGDLGGALSAVDDSLRLRPENRSSLLLKGTILEGLGRHAEATAVRERAEFLPQGNWSERSAIR